MLIPCKKCNEKIEHKLKVCPHCGQDPPFSFVPVMVLCLFILLFINMCDGPGRGQLDAVTICHDGIRSQLKSPGSASFSGHRDSDDGKGTWRVYGNVDAQNSFGGMMRSSFRCKITFEADGTTTFHYASMF